MGSQIRALRLERAWSQEQLAEIAGLSVRTIQRLEQGQPASLDTIKALAASFDLPASHFHPDNSEGEPPMSTAIIAATNPWSGFKQQLAVYVVVNGGLAALNLLNQPSHLWFVYPLAGWGLALVLKAIRIKAASAG